MMKMIYLWFLGSKNAIIETIAFAIRVYSVHIDLGILRLQFFSSNMGLL